VVGSDIPNPFAELSSDPLLQGCWLVLGPEGKCPAFEPNKENLETYVRAKLLKYNPTPITVLENLSLIYLTVKKKVDVEFFNTITVNSESLLNAAFTASVDNVSPREVLTLLQSFLEDLSKQDNSRNPQRAAYIESTLKIVKEASEILDNRGKNLSSLSQIQKLFDLLDLRSGTAVTMQRFEDLIRSDLLEKLKSGDIPKDIEEILRVSGGNIESRLLASGVKNLDLVVGDLNAARQLTQQNITQFRDFFNAALGRSVLSLDKWARDAGEDLTGSNRPNGQVLGRLCALALSTQTTWTPWISWDICSRSALYSVYPDPDRKLQIQVGELQKTISSKLQSRYCTIHKFHQASRLAEILKDRVPVETLFDSLMDGSQ
jgi:flagellar biosynthesis regulator FlaF